MHSAVSAYYHWPTLWVGAAPDWYRNHSVREQGIDVRVLRDEVYRDTLAVGVPVRVLREGMFIFDFCDWEPGRPLSSDDPTDYDFDEVASIALRRATLMNAHLACLHTAIAKLQNFSHVMMVVTPSDIISIQSFEESWGGAGSHSLAGELSMSSFPTTYNPYMPPDSDWRLRFRGLTVELPTLRESFRLLNSITNNGSESLLDFIDLYARGGRAYQDHNYSLCLVTSWTICERLLYKTWERYLKDNRQKETEHGVVPFINRDRKKRLEDSRSFTASVVSEVLSLTERLPYDTYKELSEIRQARNRWVHDLEPVTRETALTAMRVTGEMLHLVEDIDLELPLNVSLHG